MSTNGDSFRIDSFRIDTIPKPVGLGAAPGLRHRQSRLCQVFGKCLSSRRDRSTLCTWAAAGLTTS